MHLILELLADLLKAGVSVLSHSNLHFDARLLHLVDVEDLHLLKLSLKISHPDLALLSSFLQIFILLLLL